MKQSRVSWFSLRQQLFVLAVIAVVVELASVTITASVYKSGIQTRINTIAAAIDGQRVSSLRQADAVSQPADYAHLKQQLQRVKSVNGDAYSIYLVARNAQGVYTLVDSEQPGTKAYMPAGQTYSGAPDALTAMFENGRPAVEGPKRKQGSMQLSAFAPVIDDQAYSLPAVIGMDIPAKTYGMLLGLASGIPLVITALGAALITSRSRSARTKASEDHLHQGLASIVAHELREPLAGLHWYVGHVLQAKTGAKAMRSAVGQICDNVEQLRNSSDDLRQMIAVGPSGRRQASAQATDIRSVMRDVVAAHSIQAEQQRVTLTLSGSWPATLVLQCNARQIKHVFTNLLSNAIMYSQPDTRVTIGYGRANDGSHIISFQDYGIGIPAAEQAKVWLGSYRASNAEARGISGSGMGLHVAREIAEQQGGDMWIESEEHRGTTVYISLIDR